MNSVTDKYINGVHIIFLERYPRVTLKQSLWNDLSSSIFIIRRCFPRCPSQTCADTNNKGKKKLPTCHCLKRLRSECYINGCIIHTIHRYTVLFPQTHCDLRDQTPTMKVGYDVGFCIKRLFKFKWDLSIFHIVLIEKSYRCNGFFFHFKINSYLRVINWSWK